MLPVKTVSQSRHVRLQPNSFLKLLRAHSHCCCSAMVDCPAILMLIINFSLELFNGPVLFRTEKVDYMHYSHSNIVVLLQTPPPLSTTCIHIHPHIHTHMYSHTHTHTRLAVMKYVHTVYSLINWGCRLRHKRLHKAIPCGYFSLFIFFTWKWTAELLLLESPWVSQCDCTNLGLTCRSAAETITNRKAERVAVGREADFPCPCAV